MARGAVPVVMGLTVIVKMCMGTFTAGTAVSVASDCSIEGTTPFGPLATDSIIVEAEDDTTSVTVPASSFTVSISVYGIFLVGATSPISSVSQTTSESITPNPSDTNTNQDTNTISTGSIVGATIGGTLGATFLLGLGFAIIRRHRRNRVGGAKGDDVPDSSESQDSQTDQGRQFDGAFKPELEGSQISPTRFQKLELDANATRSELEVPMTNVGDGSRELQGNEIPAELEARSFRAELEG
ncbi:hypothetical protein M426DRAFT_261967 [Hypoxylon sp. CI-4A]|nr:hypothetical protein M426DRAFT_261967 [Hypoxylon sp. CI-4A]